MRRIQRNYENRYRFIHSHHTSSPRIEKFSGEDNHVAPVRGEYWREEIKVLGIDQPLNLTAIGISAVYGGVPVTIRAKDYPCAIG